MKEVKKFLKRPKTTDAVILHRLMDGKKHKRKDLAKEADVDPRTVQRSIERLSLYFIIHTFRGGDLKGGIYLDPQHIYYGLTKE